MEVEELIGNLAQQEAEVRSVVLLICVRADREFILAKAPVDLAFSFASSENDKMTEISSSPVTSQPHQSCTRPQWVPVLPRKWPLPLLTLYLCVGRSQRGLAPEPLLLYNRDYNNYVIICGQQELGFKQMDQHTLNCAWCCHEEWTSGRGKCKIH